MESYRNGNRRKSFLFALTIYGNLYSRQIFTNFQAIDLKITIKPVKIEYTRPDGSKIHVSPPSLPPILLQKYDLADPHLPVFARLISHKYITTSLEHEDEQPIEEPPAQPSLFGKITETLKEYSPLPEAKKPKQVLSKTLVIHFHGGGFIAQVNRGK